MLIVERIKMIKMDMQVKFKISKSWTSAFKSWNLQCVYKMLSISSVNGKLPLDKL